MATDTAKQVDNETDDIFGEIAALLDVKIDQAAPAAETPAKPSTDETEAPTTTPAQADAATEETDDDTADADPEETAGEAQADDADAESDQAEEGTEADEKPADEPEPTKVQQRIDKLTAQKHELAEQLETAKADLEAARAQAQAQPPVVTLDPENPLSSFTDPSALEAEIARAQAVLDWTDDNRDGASVMVRGEEKHYSADDIKTLRASARDLVKAGPKQREYLQVRAQTLPEAQATYPDFFKKGSAAYQTLQATLKQYPFLAKMPNLELVIGDAFEGQRLRMTRLEQLSKRKAASKSPNSTVKTAATAKAPARPSTSPKVSAPETALRHKADAVFKAQGDARNTALEQLMESIV